MTKQRISLNLDQDVIEKLSELAEKQGSSVSSLVNSILKAGLDTQSEMITALEGMTINRLLEVLTAEGRKKKRK